MIRNAAKLKQEVTLELFIEWPRYSTSMTFIKTNTAEKGNPGRRCRYSIINTYVSATLPNCTGHAIAFASIYRRV